MAGHGKHRGQLGASESTVAAPTPASPRLLAGHRDHTFAEENGNAEEKAKPTYS